MAEVVSGTMCAIHPGELALAACDRCGKPLCAHCRREDVATDSVYCSDSCLASRPAAAAESAVTSNAELLEGFKRPIVNGWKLWLRTFPALAAHIAPLALLGGAAYTLIPQPAPEEEVARNLGVADLSFFLVLAFGIALVQVVLSQRYTGLIRESAYVWAGKRFLPWVLAGAMAIVAAMVGFLALIVPGVIFSLRLFWADEFALVHGSNPIRALKESWLLTKGEMGQIFVFQFIAGLAAYIPLIVMAFAFVALMTVAELVSGGTPAHEFVLGSLLSFLLLTFYSVLHAPEIVYFYGMRAARSAPLDTKILNI